MRQRKSEATAEEWFRRKARSEEFFEACFVDEQRAAMVDEAQKCGKIDMNEAQRLWKAISRRQRH